MALKIIPCQVQYRLIHHSDRGTQYYCEEYIKILNKHHIQISKTENGDPLENAIAERLNGIMKEEYLQHYMYKNINELQDVSLRPTPPKIIQQKILYQGFPVVRQ